MDYTITFYSDTVRDEILAMPKTFKARFITLADRMVESGANLGEPHTKAMGGGLFEMRLKSVDGIARVFYCTLIGKHIVMLHSFVKKTQKTPAKDLKLAQARMKEMKP